MQWFSNLPIGRKLALGFGTVAILLVGVGYEGVSTARRINALMSEMQVSHAIPALHVKEANGQMLRIARAVRNTLLDGDVAIIDKRAAEIRINDSTFHAEFELYAKHIKRDEQKQQAA